MLSNIRTRHIAGDLEFYDVATGNSLLTINDSGVLSISGTPLTATATELNRYSVFAYMADAGTAGSVFVVVPHGGTIKGLCVTPYAQNTTTKTVFTAEIATVAVTHAAWELQVNDAAGTVSSVVPTAANVIGDNAALELISDGGTDATMPVMFTVIIER